MKLAFITQDFQPEVGGIQTYSYEICTRLFPKCDDFFLIAPDKPGAAELDAEFEFDIIRIKTKNTFLGWASIPTIMNLLKKRPVDIIYHAQWHTVPMSYKAKQKGLIKHIVIAAHGREFFFNPYTKIPLLNGWYERFKRRMLSRVDLVLAVSQYTSDAAGLHGVPVNKRRVIINGTDPSVFYPMDGEALKSEYGYEGKQVILTMARLVERKGVDTIIRAVALLAEEYPALVLAIGGKGPYEAQLQRLVIELNIKDKIRFEGWIIGDKSRAFYNMADVFVMTPLSRIPVEGFGIVFLEANACETPVIGSYAGGVPDAIIDGETGILIEDENPGALAMALRKILGDKALAKRMGIQGRKRVEKEANWDEVTKKIYDSMASLIE